MKLGAIELKQVTDKLDQIEEMGVHVTEFLYGDHRYMLGWDGNSPHLKGIMRADEPKSHGNMRGN